MLKKLLINMAIINPAHARAYEESQVTDQFLDYQTLFKN